MPKPPDWFIRAINALDPLLSVRWGQIIGQFVVERKAFISQFELQYLKNRAERLALLAKDTTRKDHKKLLDTYRGVAEELIAAQQGRRVIFFAKSITQDTYNMLCLSDIKRYGGYSRLADDLEEMETKAEKKIEKAAEDRRETVNREVFDILQFLFRKRSAALDHGHRNLNELLHGRKSDAPIIPAH